MENKIFKVLPLSIKVGTVDGIAKTLILRGTPLPTKRNSTFSTSSNNQKVVAIKVFLGESPVCKNNKEIGTFMLTGIPLMEKGKPQILIDFNVDETLKISIQAFEKISNVKLDNQIDNIQISLTTGEIQGYLAKAELNKNEDDSFLKLFETKQKAQSLIERAEKYLQSSLFKIDDKGKIETAIASLGLELESNNFESLLIKINELEKLIPSPNGFEGFGELFDVYFGSSSPKKLANSKNPIINSSPKVQTQISQKETAAGTIKSNEKAVQIDSVKTQNKDTSKQDFNSEKTNSKSNIKIFISHSSKDVNIAEAVIDLLRGALNMSANQIRCTSVEGYRLPIGADTSEQLREEICDTKFLSF